MATDNVPAKRSAKRIASRSEQARRAQQVESDGEVLQPGCWAEHKKDNSLILIETVDSKKAFIVYTIFEFEQLGVVEYRDKLDFEKFLEYYDADGKKNEQNVWLWHDKSEFPWDKIISDGNRQSVTKNELTVDHRIERLEHAMTKQLVTKESIATKKQEISSWRKIANQIKSMFEGLC